LKALKFAKTMDVDLIALGGDLVNFPSPESVNDVYQELAKLPGLYSHSVGQ
jgi:DNA repair exonuclease SbcCD nuclease subunit